MKIIDCHCHIYPGKIAEKATDAIGDFYNIPMSKIGTVEGLLDPGVSGDITQQVVHSVATTPKQVSSVNTFIYDNIKSHPGRFIGFGTIHPDSQTPEEDIENIISLGLKGIKIHPDFIKTEIDAPGFMKAFEIIGGRLPVCIHGGDKRYDYSNPDRMKHVLESFPDVRIIVAHLGGYSVWDEAERTLPGIENLWVDTSSSLPFLDNEKAVRIIRKFGCERVIFGSDYPMWTPKDELEHFLRLGLTDKEKQLILHENAEKLIGIQE